MIQFSDEFLSRHFFCHMLLLLRVLTPCYVKHSESPVVEMCLFKHIGLALPSGAVALQNCLSALASSGHICFKTNKWNQCFLSACRLLTKEASVKIKSFWLLPVLHQLKLEDIFHVFSSPNGFLFQKRGAFVGKRLRRDSTF